MNPDIPTSPEDAMSTEEKEKMFANLKSWKEKTPASPKPEEKVDPMANRHVIRNLDLEMARIMRNQATLGSIKNTLNELEKALENEELSGGQKQKIESKIPVLKDEMKKTKYKR
jgi:hypothetical protein